MEIVVLERDAGEVVTDRPERRVVIAHDRPAMTITESRYGPGERGPGPHVHHHHVDAFAVLAGELTFRLGPDLAPVLAPAGTLVLVPPRVVHTFANEGAGDARFVNVHAPGMGFGAHLLTGGDEGDFDSGAPPDDGGRAAVDAVVVPPGAGERAGACEEMLELRLAALQPGGVPAPPPAAVRPLDDGGDPAGALVVRPGHRAMMREAIELEGDAHRALLARDAAAARTLFAAAAESYRWSWEAAPPEAYGRLVGMVKAAVLAGRGEQVAAQAVCAAVGDEPPSPTAAYALAVASLVQGDDEAARRSAGSMGGGTDAFSRTADAITALTHGDEQGYRRALEAIVADFAARDAHLTGVPIADTALMLERLAARRGLATGMRSELLPDPG